MPTREETAAGALLGTFAGDALGARWEGSRPAPDRASRDRLRRSEDDAELVYTDDTQLTLALAEHLCDAPHVDPERLAATFLAHYQPWRGYGAGMHGIIEEWRKGTSVEDAATAIFPSGSFGNGAAMRVAPVGVLWADHPDTLEAVAGRQAAVTHVHTLGIDGALVQARAVGLAAGRGRFGRGELAELAGVPSSDELRTGVEAAAELVDGWSADEDLEFADVAKRLGNTVTAQRSVPAALWAAATPTGCETGSNWRWGWVVTPTRSRRWQGPCWAPRAACRPSPRLG